MTFPVKTLKKVVFKVSKDLWYKDFFEKIEKFEVFEILRYDKNSIYLIYKLKFVDPKATPDILDKEGIGIFHTEVIAEEKNKMEYICFSKTNWQNMDFAKIFNMDILLEPPIILEEDHLLVSFLIEHKDLDHVLHIQEELVGSKAEIVSITSVKPNYESLYLTLTDRQKEIMYYAVQHGFYDIPRKISGKELAAKFEISESALYEHLRKIIRMILNSIFG